MQRNQLSECNLDHGKHVAYPFFKLIVFAVLFEVNIYLTQKVLKYISTLPKKLVISMFFYVANNKVKLRTKIYDFPD